MNDQYVWVVVDKATREPARTKGGLFVVASTREGARRLRRAWFGSPSYTGKLDVRKVAYQAHLE